MHKTIIVHIKIVQSTECWILRENVKAKENLVSLKIKTLSD